MEHKIMTNLEIAKIKDAQDKAYNARMMAHRILNKAMQHCEDKTSYLIAIGKLVQGEALSGDEFNAVESLACKFNKQIPVGKLSFVKSALMSPLRLRKFNSFGQELA